MAVVSKLTFNPFQENTYIVSDETGECIIFDPGCYTQKEREELKNFISENEWTPVRLINTHCHLDHVFGNAFVAETYGLELEIHRGELPVLEAVPQVCQVYGIQLPQPSPSPGRFIETGDTILFGNTSLKALFTPGHSPASLSFYCEADKFIIAGDVLFFQSIGRTDLPGGDMATLLGSIKDQLFPLGDDVAVHPGHGPDTSIGYEKQHNLFLQ